MNAKEWKRLNAVFQDALAKYPYSQHALHYLWNNAIATGPETFKPPPPPPLTGHSPCKERLPPEKL